MPVTRLTKRVPLAILSALVLALAGCPKGDSDAKQKVVERPLAGVKFRLAVVDDPALAAAAARVQGEWNAQTGADFEVIQTSQKALLTPEPLSADAVICPAWLAGVLAERNRVAPVPKSVLHSRQWTDVFSLLRFREAAWRNQTIAVPFGSPTFCCYCRTDLLKKLGRNPPRTWNEYQELAQLMAAQKLSPDWCGAVEPLAPGWAGLVLLARAAPYARHRDNFSTLFDMDTMEPLVATEPFVRALTDLVAAAKLGPPDLQTYDPAKARAAFWAGKCGMAITWPTAAKEKRDSGAPSPTKAPPVTFAELPGSRDAFSTSSGKFDRRADDDSSQVPLLSIAGRLGVVAKDSPHAEAAFQLLLWLSDDERSPQVSAASPATTLFRQSNLSSPAAWVEKSVSVAAAVKYSDVAEATFRREQWVEALRLPGRPEYLAALDTAVADAVSGKKSPQDALNQAAAKWRTITKRLGLPQQRTAYRHSLGLD